MENPRPNYLNSTVSALLENPGIEFHPTEKELVEHYLTHKNNGSALVEDHIDEVNVYGLNPFHLPEVASFPYTSRGQLERQPRWYFYMDKDFINNDRNGTRIANGGYWKKRGPVKPINGNDGAIIGVKKCFVFYTVNSVGMDLLTDWIMHEYSLSHNPEAPFVLCRLFRQSSIDPVDQVVDLSQTDHPSSDY